LEPSQDAVRSLLWSFEHHRYRCEVKNFGVRTTDEPAFAGQDVEVVQPTSATGAAVSWSAAIAGALVATAVTFVVVLLGAGIQLAMASTNTANPTVGAATIAGAVWLVLAQTLGFAVGGHGRTLARQPWYGTVCRDTLSRRR
jgi:hypothetical protein